MQVGLLRHYQEQALPVSQAEWGQQESPGWPVAQVQQEFLAQAQPPQAPRC